MSSELYESYPKNKSYMEYFIRYQERYAKNIPDRDRRLIELLIRNLSVRDRPSILDIGCSTGNLLLHLRRALGNSLLVGVDLSNIQLEVCRNNPDLEGISFELLDFRKLDSIKHSIKHFDAITANAVLQTFPEAEFSKCLESMAKATKPGGVLVAFDWFHPFEQDLDIVERSNTFPGGHPLHIRSYQTVEHHLKKAGYNNIQFKPFNIETDLAKQGYDSVGTWTQKSDSSERMMFRGTLYQPWCHLVAQK